jgi:hypothetical protein
VVSRPLDSTGHASLTTVLGAGSHAVSASFAGVADFATSSGSLTAPISVSQAGTSTTLSVSPPAPQAGQPVTLTAIVTGVPVGVSGSSAVTFYDGNIVLGTAPLSGGTASLTVLLGTGNHTLRAVFAGDANVAGSAASVAVNNVAPAITATVTRFHKRPKVLVSNANGSPRFSFFPYKKNFKGPVRVVIADVNGDGFPDVIVAPGRGNLAEPVLTFDGRTGAPIGRIRLGAAAAKGVRVAAGDVNGDGKAEVLVGVGPQLRVYDGTSGALLFVTTPFGKKSPRTVQVAAVDVTGSGVDAIVAVSGSKLAGFDGVTKAPLSTSSLTPFLGQIMAQASK